MGLCGVEGEKVGGRGRGVECVECDSEGEEGWKMRGGGVGGKMGWKMGGKMGGKGDRGVSVGVEWGGRGIDVWVWVCDREGG